MSELSRAQKLASAKKKLKQFQQKHRDVQSESGRSTPTKKKTDEDGFEIVLNSENGGSTCSLSNNSGTDSPVVLDSLCQVFNGISQPDLPNTSTILPTVSEKLFQAPSPNYLSKTFPPQKSGVDFFDNLPLLNLPNESSQVLQSQDVIYTARSLLNTAMCQPPQINASTPDGPLNQHTPNYSFPDASFSPIKDARNNTMAEIVIKDLELKLKNSEARNEELEKELVDQRNQVLQLQSALEEIKRGPESVSTLKDHVQAMEILVSENKELQNTLAKLQECQSIKAGELGELQGRLRASRHRVSDLERQLQAITSQLQTREATIKELTERVASFITHADSQGKRVGDLELEVSDLHSKIEARDEMLKSVEVELEEKNSKLGLAEVRIQQLSGGPDYDTALEELNSKNKELSISFSVLESQLNAANAAKEESVQEYQHYVSRLHAELEQHKHQVETFEDRCVQLTHREYQLVQQVSELEKQLSRATRSEIVPELGSLRAQLQTAEECSNKLQTQLQEKTNEMELLQEGLQERAVRIQELEMTVARLEAEWPDTATLQAAIESDKVAASRAMAQNAYLKKQLEELQDTLAKLNTNREELSEQLQIEQKTNEMLKAKLHGVHLEEPDKAGQRHGDQTTPAVVGSEVTLQLEEKVRKTMAEIAVLNEEKQRLEHLVLQLQGETETIGEYIALYQVQRGMLQQRAQEKDKEVAQLARDKEVLRDQLTHLNCLVQRLVDKQGINIDKTLQGAQVVQEAAPKETTNKDTAEQIKSLLTEIGSNKLVIPSSESSNINFHPCPWCSGRLITV